MRRLLFLLPLLVAPRASAQGCDESALLQKPGLWKEGMKGSVTGIPAASLAVERNVVAAVHTLLKQSYSPRGLEAVHAAGYQRPYPEMLAWPYQYTIYLMPYNCDGAVTKTAGETGSTVMVSANATDIQFSHDIASAFLDEADKNHYGWLRKMPVLKDGTWNFGEIEVASGFGIKVKEYKWLIVYEGKLPFQFVTRKEYLEKAGAIFRKLRQGESPGGKKRYDDMLIPIDRLAKSLTAEELQQPAIVQSMGDFSEFLKEGERFAVILVKENPDYYDRKLSKAAPQLFTVVLTIDDKQPVFAQAYADLMKALNFTALKGMLGVPR